MSPSRRTFLAVGSASLAGGIAASGASAQEVAPPSGARVSNPIGVSTYSFWRFLPDQKLSIVACLEAAAEIGFDAVEILERQMESTDKSAVAAIKRRALTLGMPLCGLSTHQGFCSPDAEIRKQNIATTIRSIELAYDLGIPTIRINTGRWGTTKSFDQLMADRGIEPPLPGYTDEDAYPWVIGSIEECLPVAEKCGVVLGLENHWGLGRTPEGVLRIAKAVDSPWLGVTLDTGNFLENPYDKLALMAPHATFVQAKTYDGGGIWYALELDYPRIAKILRDAGYRGFISLEFEGRADWKTALPKSLALLRSAFTG
jgi:sugar phosphate isomerase/epimerase